MTTITTDYSQYITSDWLQAHAGAGQMLKEQPGFLEFLNSQPEYAQLFTQSPEGGQQAAQAAVDAGAVPGDAMGLLIGQANLAQGSLATFQDEPMFTDYNQYMTADWLRGAPQVARQFSENPDLVQFFNDNPNYAQMLTEGKESGQQAMQAAREALQAARGIAQAPAEAPPVEQVIETQAVAQAAETA